jgi:3-deoxy-D-manno-octulosonic-acid transferase
MSASSVSGATIVALMHSEAGIPVFGFTRAGKEIILIAGSTHSGEEEILIGLFKELREFESHLVLLLAPRHLDRLEEVERILKKNPSHG